MLKSYQQNADATTLTPSTEETLQSHLMDYNFSFNTLPPVDRLIIPSLGLDVPIVIPENVQSVDFAKDDFDKELSE